MEDKIIQNFKDDSTIHYNKSGYPIYMLYSNGEEREIKYDENNLKVLETFKGHEKSWERHYNNNEFIIHYKDSLGNEWKKNQFGKLVYNKHASSGLKEWFQYNDKQDLIFMKDSNGNKTWVTEKGVLSYYDYNKKFYLNTEKINITDELLNLLKLK